MSQCRDAWSTLKASKIPSQYISQMQKASQYWFD